MRLMARATMTVPNRYGGAELGGAQFGVGDLEGHPDGEGQVGEVGEPRLGGGVAVVEVDALTTTGVVQQRIPQCEDRVHDRP
jgi:hypothetical protein